MEDSPEEQGDAHQATTSDLSAPQTASSTSELDMSRRTSFPFVLVSPSVSHARLDLQETQRSSSFEASAIQSEPTHNIRFYLEYHRRNITIHHYIHKYDFTDFLHTDYLSIALQYEPLLYAVVGFAAYHHTISNPRGQLQDFLGYYHKAVSLLRLSLLRRAEPTIATLLTILQLATFEVPEASITGMQQFTGADWLSRSIWATGSIYLVTKEQHTAS